MAKKKTIKAKEIKAWMVVIGDHIVDVWKEKRWATDFAETENHLLGGRACKVLPCTITYQLKDK
jgi:hypothetical protein